VDVSERRTPIHCLKCGVAVGAIVNRRRQPPERVYDPARVALVRRVGIRLTLRCAGCGHEWGELAREAA
jgi:DNA-directed RNA polymerase subunit N (RpoN/RPB10)